MKIYGWRKIPERLAWRGGGHPVFKRRLNHVEKGRRIHVRGCSWWLVWNYTGWEQVDSKWRGATRILAPAGSIRNGFTFFRSASAGPAFMRGGGTACRQPAFMLKGREGK